MKINNTDKTTRKLGAGMVVAMWVIVLGLLTMFFQSREEKQYNPNQAVSTDFLLEGVRELVLERNRWGHYVANGEINGQEVTFMLDTGATDVSIPLSVADKLGLEKGRALIYQTANGPAKVYASILDQVSLGAISLNNIRASINPNMHQQEVLLGMSFLKHLEFTQRGNTLSLRQYPR